MVTRFPALFYPLGNWLCLLFMAAVLVIMLMTPGMAISVWLIGMDCGAGRGLSV